MTHGSDVSYFIIWERLRYRSNSNTPYTYLFLYSLLFSYVQELIDRAIINRASRREVSLSFNLVGKVSGVDLSV